MMGADETERLAQALTAADERLIAALDLQRLEVENAGRTFQADEPIYSVLNSLRLWENLAGRMEDGWHGPYIVDEYLNLLCVRGTIGEFLDAMPDAARAKFDECLGRLDARFRSLTFEDGGVKLSYYWRPLREGRETGWWWMRYPLAPPSNW